jgi:tRNA(Ile)-lysidine synthase
MAEPLAARVARELDQLGLARGTWLVAVSGGPDSVALLHLLAGLAPARGLSLVAAHVDHGLHAGSALVAARVRALADTLGVPFVTTRLDLPADASETAARVARYAWLRSEMARRNAHGILTAHHLDDQAETVLMRVLRGSGPAGLAAMGRVAGDLVRPLLPFRREELAQYLLDAGIESWIDPANADPRHLRSWLRTAVLPALRERLPDVDERLRDVAVQARRDVEAWDRVLDLVGLDARPSGAGLSVLLAPLRSHDPALRERLLQALSRRLGRPLPRATARRIGRLLDKAASGRRTMLGEGWVAELAFDRLVIGPLAEAPGDVTLEGDGRLVWGIWVLEWRREAAGVAHRGGWSTWVVPGGALSVGAPRAGEKVRPLGGTGRRLLVRLLQEAQVPRSGREGWPVLRRGERVLWLAGVARGEDEIPREGEEAIRLDVHPR